MILNNLFTDTYAWSSQVLMPSFAEDWPLLPVVRAEGAYLYTADGRRYLDFTSGIAVTNVGHGHPRVLAAARQQMEKFSQVSSLLIKLIRHYWMPPHSNGLVGSLNLSRLGMPNWQLLANARMPHRLIIL